jgi:putative addiction module killer protein
LSLVTPTTAALAVWGANKSLASFVDCKFLTRILCSTNAGDSQNQSFHRLDSGLRDNSAVARIDVRIRRLSLGNAGEFKSVGDGVFELRIDHGPGYRVYFLRQGEFVGLLLCSGDKRTQDQDIKAAKNLAKDYGNAA